MPTPKQPAIVHGYQVPGEVRPKITGAETVTWYVEPDAQEQASKLAGGRSVALPYFFCGNPPEEGKTWTKHRRGGLAFVRNWLERFAHEYDAVKMEVGGKPAVPVPDATFDGDPPKGLKAAAQKAADEAKPNFVPQPTDAETVEALQVSHAQLETRYQEAVQRADAGQERADTAEAKLKAERATTRGLRKDLKEAQERAATADAGANDLARRVNNQQDLLNDMDTTAREQRLALRRILDRAQVAYGVINHKPYHALAELRSIREIAKAMLPGTPEAQRDDGAAV